MGSGTKPKRLIFLALSKVPWTGFYRKDWVSLAASEA